MKKKLFIIPILLTIIISSCSFSKNIMSDRVKISYQSSDLSNDKFDITVQIPEFKNMENSEFEHQLNEYFFNDIQNKANEFTKTASDFSSDIPDGKKASLNITCHDEYNDKDFLSMIITVETYTGGVHGTITDIAANIDLRQNKIIELSDLFNDDCDYKKILTKILCSLAEENTELYGELWENPAVTDSTPFYIKDDCLIIYFQPYELASYGRGFVDFSIPFSSLKTYLKEDFYRFAE